jgi:CelD/BcsL family acetyltransferase involved in cellulose biosynthesis
VLRQWGVRFVSRSFPLCGTSPPFDVLIGERAEDVMRAFLETWHRAADGRWDLIEWLNVRAESPTAPLLRSLTAGSGCRFEECDHLLTYYVPVTTSWDELLASRTKKFRQNLRRGERRCAEIGTMRCLQYPTDGIDLARALDMMSEVVGRSWKRGADDVRDGDRFFRELARSLDRRGWLSLRFLTIGGRPIAYLFEIDYRGNLHAFHSAYDLEFQPVDPGLLLLSAAIRCAHDRGYGRYDFTGTEDYLHRWTDHRRSYRRLSLINGSWASRAKTAVFRFVHARRYAAAKRRTELMKAARKAQDAAEGDA